MTDTMVLLVQRKVMYGTTNIRHPLCCLCLCLVLTRRNLAPASGTVVSTTYPSEMRNHQTSRVHEYQVYRAFQSHVTAHTGSSTVTSSSLDSEVPPKAPRHVRITQGARIHTHMLLCRRLLPQRLQGLRVHANYNATCLAGPSSSP